MATQVHQVTANAADLVAELALANGADHLVQVIGRRPCRLAEAAAAPADSTAGHLVLPGRTWTVTAGATPLWCWCDEPGGSRVAVTEA